jgi:outer membrane protein assembly factor BamB
VKRATLSCGLVAACCLAVAATARADNWPSWRGPDNNGISRETGLPTHWGPDKNLAWKLELPGMGGSTPVVWGEHIFLTSSAGKELVLLCAGTDGKLRWQRKLGRVVREKIKRDEANEASPSPSTDGKHVYAFAGSGDLACFDFAGKEVWQFNVQDRYGKFSIYHGIHTTPLLHKGRLYLTLLHARGHWVIALDKATGKEVWKVERRTDAKGESTQAYTSPCLVRAGREEYLVVLGCDYATAHRLSDGAEVWRLGGLNPADRYSTSFRIISSPVAGPDLLVVPTARGSQVVGVRAAPPGEGKGAAAPEIWRAARGSPDVPSPLEVGGLVYLCRENGVLICLDAMTGAKVYEKRLHGARYRASPVYADGKVYLTARDGVFSVVKAGRTFELLATNELPDSFTASPAVANGRIYLRGFRALYAVSKGGKTLTGE